MDIVVQRGVVRKLEELPNYSIALDGFVQGPRVDPDNHKYSFDHHQGCLRYCTTSACMQAWTAINLGLDPEKFSIYANDVDSDVCVAIWCLKNPERCMEPLVIKLVNAVGIGDMHSGAIPVNGMNRIVEWISAPETDSKRHDDYGKLSDDGLVSILESILHRIDLYVDGEASIEVAKSFHKHGEYKILRNENDWVLAESSDSHANAALFQAGFDRIVRIHHQDDGSLAVTIAKRSDFIGGFPLEKFMVRLNELERQRFLEKNPGYVGDIPEWGGGSTIEGAPRNADGSRSLLTVDQIIEVIDQIILNNP